MTICSEALGIEDIVLEGKAGNVRSVAGLPTEQVVGILANTKKQVDQLADVITDEKGLGSYGLTLEQLQLAGIVKCGITLGADLETTLSDPSVFTGKRGISNVNILLGNEVLQKRIMQDVISKSMNTLEQEGVITGTKTTEELAAIAALSANYSIDDIKSFTNDTASPELAEEMTAIQDAAETVAALIETKASSILNTISGIGGGASKAVESAGDLIDLTSVKAALDDFIGSNRVPSALSDISEQITKAAGSLSKGDLF